MLSKQCVLCLEPSHNPLPLCAPCRKDLPILKHACTSCAAPLSTNAVTRCAICQKKPPPQDFALCHFLYDSPIKQLLTQLKFQKKVAYGRLLGNLCATHLQDYYQQHPECLPEAIIPVPLSLKRMSERGFNQAERIAKPIGKELGLPILRNACHRKRHTAPQLSLPAKDRHKNLLNAFEIKNSLTLNGRPIEHVALIDDVITTAATLESLATEVKRVGVKTVTLWGVARTPLN